MSRIIEDDARSFFYPSSYQTQPLSSFTNLLTPHLCLYVLIAHGSLSTLRCVGRKFSSRLRKDLDETSERTRVSLRSCRRQFDNVKRVFRTLEEMPGNFIHNIKTNFLLPPALAEKYSVIVFIACHRFEINKKKLNYLSFDDFSTVCKTIMTDWTCAGVDVDENGDPCLDRDFFYSLRDLKCLLEKEKEHRYSVCQMLAKSSVMKQRSLSEVEANFKNINKNMIWLGQTLYNNKEVKDLFVNVVDKVVEPLKQYKFTLEDLSQVKMKTKFKKVSHSFFIVSQCLHSGGQ